MKQTAGMYEAALAIVAKHQRCSTSMLQRRLRNNYTAAASNVDLMEEKGLVGPPRGSEPREVFVDEA